MSATLGTTYAARWFEHNRGRALSLAGLRYPVSEAVMPIATTVGIALMGWRGVWMVNAIALAILGTVLVRFILAKGQNRCEAEDSVDEGNGFAMGNSKKRMDKSIYRDPLFLLMVGVVAPLPFVGTGVIFF